jgi:hypothetical protein
MAIAYAAILAAWAFKKVSPGLWARVALGGNVTVALDNNRPLSEQQEFPNGFHLEIDAPGFQDPVTNGPTVATGADCDALFAGLNALLG